MGDGVGTAVGLGRGDSDGRAEGSASLGRAVGRGFRAGAATGGGGGAAPPDWRGGTSFRISLDGRSAVVTSKYAGCARSTTMRAVSSRNCPIRIRRSSRSLTAMGSRAIERPMRAGRRST